MIEKSYKQTLAWMICHIPIDWFVQNVSIFIFIVICTCKNLYEHLFNQSFLVQWLCCFLSRSSVVHSFFFLKTLLIKICSVMFFFFYSLRYYVIYLNWNRWMRHCKIICQWTKFDISILIHASKSQNFHSTRRYM